jgi:hypothetical protein
MVEQMDEYSVLSMVEMMGWYLADSMAVPLVQHWVGEMVDMKVGLKAEKRAMTLAELKDVEWVQ